MADIVKVKKIQDSSGTSHDIAARSLLDSSGNEYTSDSFLKLTGGTLTATSGDNPLVIKPASGQGASYIKFLNGSGTLLGYFGVNSSKQPVFYDSSNHRLAYYSDLPSVSNATITIKQTGISDQTFTLNGSATTITLADTNTHYTNYFQIKGNGTEAAKFIQSGDVSLNFAGSGATSVSASSGTITISSTDNDTKNTAGSTDTSSKIFLIGATSQAANPQTYSDNEVFATSGVLSAKSFNLAPGATSKATMQYNTNEDCIDFIFS